MKLKVSVAQMGPFCKDQETNLGKAVELLERAVSEHAPDVVAFTEMMTTPYFCGVIDDRYFEMAEKRDGRTVTTLAKKARELGTHVIGTWFEKEEVKGGRPRYYNSAGVFSPDAGLVGVYRKCHIPKVETADLITDEKYYFEGGDGFQTFRVKGVDFGIVICYDRSFPESWRTLWLKGAKVVFALVSTYGFREGLFVKELEIRAFENHLYVVAANKAGTESVEGEKIPRRHFGSSCVIDPLGNLVRKLDDTPFCLLHETLDLDRVAEARAKLDFRRDRRPDLYKIITEPNGSEVTA